MPRHLLISMLVATAMLAPSANVSAQETSRRCVGRALDEILREMQRDGLALVFSSDLVKPEMCVPAEPKQRDPRKRLEEVLRPWGLGTQPGQNNTLLVVRRRTPPASAALPGEVTGTVRGTVVDGATGAPLEGVIIQVTGLAKAVRTDAAGAFVLEQMRTGRQVLYVSLVGYALARPIAEVKPRETIELRVTLAAGTSAYNEALTVRPDRVRVSDVTVPSQQRLGNAEVQTLRGVLADDPMRAVQSLPGVVASTDFKSEFSVRGADFAHIGMSLDGIEVPWPVHTVRGRDDSASLSIFNSDVLDHVTLASAAYPQRAGSTTGAWLDVALRDGSRSAAVTHGAVSATAASAVVEAPIAHGRGSWIASIRQSYLDWLLRAVGTDEDTTFGFLDHQSRLVFDLSDRHQIEFNAVAGRSSLGEREIDPGPNSIHDGDTDTAVVTTGVRSVVGRAVIRQRVSFIHQGFDNTGDFGQALGEGSFRSAGYRTDVSFQPWRSTTIDGAAEIRREEETRAIRHYRRTAQGTLIADDVDAFAGSSWSSSGYVNMLWNASSRLAVSPGIRVAHSTLTDETLGSPWLQARWRIGSSSIRAGTGLYQQLPMFGQVLGDAGNANLKRERALHADLSFEQALPHHLRWQATIYTREERDMLRLEYSEPKLDPPPAAPRYENALNGSARGVELVLERSDSVGLSGWISYAYGRARYDDAQTGESFWGDFDQRHTVSLFGQYRLSGRLNLSAKFRSGSNVPIAGYFVARDGGYYLSDRRNELRLPIYSRLDLRADRTFHFSKRRLTLFVEILNVLNRENIGRTNGSIRTRTLEAVDYVETLFPLLPTAGFLIEF